MHSYLILFLFFSYLLNIRAEKTIIVKAPPLPPNYQSNRPTLDLTIIEPSQIHLHRRSLFPRSNTSNASAQHILRYDYRFSRRRNSLVLTSKLQVLHEEPSLEIHGFGDTDSLLSEDPFKIIFICDASPSFCKRAEKSFTNAINALSQTLIIHTQIVIHARIFSFCKNQGPNCKESKTLGQCSSASFYGVQARPGQSILYPQALLKQFQLKKTPEWNPADILAEFNADADFWFPGDGKPKEQQYDFSYVVTHEIVHALAFASAFRTHLGHPFLTPIPDLSSSRNTLTRWIPPFVFDTFIVNSQSGERLIDIAQEFWQNRDNGDEPNQQELNSTNNRLLKRFSNRIASVVNNELPIFEVSSSGKTARHLYQLATTPGALAFKIPRSMLPTEKQYSYYDRLVYLETSLKPFAPGSSLSHVAWDYSNSRDFLMRAKATNGITLKHMLVERNMTDDSGYKKGLFGIFNRRNKEGKSENLNGMGPRTLAILNSMGWELRVDLKELEFDTVKIRSQSNGGASCLRCKSGFANSGFRVGVFAMSQLFVLVMYIALYLQE